MRPSSHLFIWIFQSVLLFEFVGSVPGRSEGRKESLRERQTVREEGYSMDTPATGEEDVLREYLRQPLDINEARLYDLLELITAACMSAGSE